MKRLLVLLAVLLPVSWFAIGCEKAPPPGSKSPSSMTKEEKEKMDKAQYELMKQKMLMQPKMKH
jgi:hypothetical protein